MFDDSMSDEHWERITNVSPTALPDGGPRHKEAKLLTRRVLEVVRRTSLGSCRLAYLVIELVQESAQADKWSFCLTAGTLCPAN